MTAYITITTLAALLTFCFILYGRARELEALADLYYEMHRQSREDAAGDSERYQATIDTMQGHINKLTLQLSARTWAEAKSLEPNTITSHHRTDADMARMIAKVKSDEREDGVYEVIGRVK